MEVRGGLRMYEDMRTSLGGVFSGPFEQRFLQYSSILDTDKEEDAPFLSFEGTM